jgi:hypothetical protein
MFDESNDEKKKEQVKSESDDLEWLSSEEDYEQFQLTETPVKHPLIEVLAEQKNYNSNIYWEDDQLIKGNGVPKINVA